MTGKCQCRLHLERLEDRNLMTVVHDDDTSLLDSHGTASRCPICTGMALQQIDEMTHVGPARTIQFAVVPAGPEQPTGIQMICFWTLTETSSPPGSYRNVTTPIFDRDGDVTGFSDLEIASITNMSARTAEDYAAFSINVTTVDPGNSTDRVTARIAIGGNYSDWYGASAGGVAYVGGFLTQLQTLVLSSRTRVETGRPSTLPKRFRTKPDISSACSIKANTAARRSSQPTIKARQLRHQSWALGTIRANHLGTRPHAARFKFNAR